jgi:hypothetical protein
MRTLNPIIRDRAGAVHPGLAAIASITGQPLTAVVQVPDRLYADERRRPRMGELLRTYARDSPKGEASLPLHDNELA